MITVISIDKISLIKKKIRPLDKENLKRLKMSIEKKGLINPITVRKESNRYILIDGLHRLTVMKEIGFALITAMILDDEG